MPDSDNPATPPQHDEGATPYAAAEITDDEFHTLADEFLEKLHDRCEEIQEGREDVEVEYSVSLSPASWLLRCAVVLTSK